MIWLVVFNSLNTLLQTIFPIGDSGVEGRFKFCFVEHTVVWACRLGWIFIGGARHHFTGGDTSQAMNRFSEIVPRYHAFIAEMINAGMPLGSGNNGENTFSQIFGISGGAYLVENHFQAIFGAPQRQHRFYKVFAKRWIQPRGADNHGIAEACL